MGLMFIVLGYLSDLRYRLFFEAKETGAASAAVEDRTEEAGPGAGGLSGSEA